MDLEGGKYVVVDKIIQEFRESNEYLNQDAFDILLLIVVTMRIQTFFHISGVLVQEDFILILKISFIKKLE